MSPLRPNFIIGRTLVALSVVLAAAAGCDTKTQYAGQPMPEYFPLDGERSWSYRQCGPDDAACVPVEARELHVVKSSTRSIGDTEVNTLRYGLFDPEQPEAADEPQFTIDWSSDSVDGILIWTASNASGDVLTYEDEPVVIADREMNTNESITTGDVTSTFIGLEPCATNWVPDTPWECVHMQVTGSNGAPFLGDWWMATTSGTAIFLPEGAEVPWVLAESIWVSSN